MVSVREANQLISSINTIMEGLAGLGKAIENLAWEQIEDHAGAVGARPIAAAELARPDLDDALAEHRATVESQDLNDQVDVDDPVVDLVHVRSVLAEVSAAGFTAEIRALISQTGVSRLSDVDPGKYGWLLAKVEELTNA